MCLVMKYLRLERINEFYHSPCIIAISNVEEAFIKSIEFLLNAHNYTRYDPELSNDYNENDRTIYLGIRGSNLFIFDDWYYSLHHDKDLQSKIKEQSNSKLYIYGWIGDSDDSFWIEVIRNKSIVRHLFVYDDWTTITVKKDIGKKLDFEIKNIDPINPIPRLNLYFKHFELGIEEEVKFHAMFYKTNEELKLLN